MVLTPETTKSTASNDNQAVISETGESMDSILRAAERKYFKIP